MSNTWNLLLSLPSSSYLLPKAILHIIVLEREMSNSFKFVTPEEGMPRYFFDHLLHLKLSYRGKARDTLGAKNMDNTNFSNFYPIFIV